MSEHFWQYFTVLTFEFPVWTDFLEKSFHIIGLTPRSNSAKINPLNFFFPNDYTDLYFIIQGAHFYHWFLLKSKYFYNKAQPKVAALPFLELITIPRSKLLDISKCFPRSKIKRTWNMKFSHITGYIQEKYLVNIVFKLVGNSSNVLLQDTFLDTFTNIWYINIRSVTY